MPEELGEAETLLADNGYFSAANVTACAAAGIEPLIAMGRAAASSLRLAERFAPRRRRRKTRRRSRPWRYRLKTPKARSSTRLRKQTPEPVFGIIKSVLGFRQFLLRGLE